MKDLHKKFCVEKCLKIEKKHILAAILENKQKVTLCTYITHKEKKLKQTLCQKKRGFICGQRGNNLLYT